MTRRQQIAAAGLFVVLGAPGCSTSGPGAGVRGDGSEWAKVHEEQAEERPAPPLLSGEFAVPAKLRPAVDFWKRVFAVWTGRHVAIHDTLDLGRVYSVLDFRFLDERGLSAAEIERYMKNEVESEIDRIRLLLIRLHQNGGKPATEEEKRIAAMFERSHQPNKFLAAADEDRLRSQTGIRERFGRGIAVGHRYFAELERVFREEGVPVEISRLPLIESCFNVEAYSKAGAAGVWQFIPSTGRRFMRIDDVIDERRDPLIAGRAAARFLRENYEKLGAWPLAITAYNHGPAGMARAVEQTGSRDIVTIIERYNGPAFRFASRNFYPEFLAALEVEREYQKYFGPLPLERPVATDVVRMPHYVHIDSVAQAAGTDPDTIAELNPSFSRGVREGRLRIPRDYAVRIPAGRGAEFERRYAALSADRKHGGQTVTYLVHRVRSGQTLHGIARHYGLPVSAIRRHNKLGSTSSVRAGQVLRIPSS